MKSTAILIAEGDEPLRRDLKSRLFRHGFEVIEAPDQTNILQSFQDTKPDLVIIGSSRDNTWDELKVVEEIRQRDRKAPLILITRHSSEARVIGALRAGVNDYFKVPFLHRHDSTPGKMRGEELRKDNQKAKPSVQGAENTGRAKDLCVAKLERVKSRFDPFMTPLYFIMPALRKIWCVAS